MSFDATYDACVLHPAGLRDFLVRLAMTALFRAHWSEDILDEMVASILSRRPNLNGAQLARTRKLMCEAVPDSVTTGYEDLIEGLNLPDPNDRHVLAAAIRSGSQVIVTENIDDFPLAILDTYGIEPQTPDIFVLHLIELSPELGVANILGCCVNLFGTPIGMACVAWMFGDVLVCRALRLVEAEHIHVCASLGRNVLNHLAGLGIPAPTPRCDAEDRLRRLDMVPGLAET